MCFFIVILITLFLSGCTNPQMDEVPQFETVDDVANERIGIIMGGAFEDGMKKKYPNGDFARYETETDLLHGLKKDDCMAIGIDDYVFNFFNHTIGGLARLDGSIEQQSLGAAFPKGKNVELRQQFNVFLKKMRESGQLEKIVRKWVDHFDTEVLPDLDIPTTGDPIRVGTSTAMPPMAFIKNGELMGVDIELLMQFAKYLNRPISFDNLNFSSLITSVSTGKADMIMSGLSITPARQQNVDFSDPYWTYDLVLIVKDIHKKGFDPTQSVVEQDTDEDWVNELQDSFHNNLIREARYEMVLSGLKTTLIIAFFSAIWGTLLGALVCFLKMRKSPFFRAIANIYINTMRGTPVLVLLLIMFYVVFNQVDIDPVTVSVITFAMNFGAYVSEMFRTSIEGIDKGQTEAGIALGFSKVKTFFYIVLPQAFKKVLPVYKGEMISMVKMTSVVGYIAVEDLTKVSDIIRSRTFDALFPLIMVAILYFIIAWLFTVVLDRIGRAFN